MSDYVVRTTTAAGEIRTFIATTRDMVGKARRTHSISPVTTAVLGRLMTARAMMGYDVRGNNDLLTLKTQEDGPIEGLTVTADSHGSVERYAFNPVIILPPNAKGKPNVDGALGMGVLSMIKDIGLKKPYVGQTILVPGEIAEDLTYYYATPEQTPSSVVLNALMNRDNTAHQVGGFIIQPLPGASESTIGRLEEKLEEVSSITTLLDVDNTSEMILEYILGELGLEISDKEPVRLYYSCTKGHVEKALISVGKKDIQGMIDDGKTIEVSYHFCGKNYGFTVDELKDTLDKAR